MRKRLVEREAITVILSKKGWIRAVRGQVADDADLQFKEGDSPAPALACETTDRLCLLATNGRAYTLKAGEIAARARRRPADAADRRIRQ